MAAPLPPSGWIEQVLDEANLPLLIPKGILWAERVGCRSCDVDEAIAVELVEHLGVKSCPARRLLDIIRQAVTDGTLIADNAYDPCQATVEEAQDLEASEEGEQEVPPSPSPPSASVYPAGPRWESAREGLQFCVTHGKMRDSSKMRRNSRGEMVCRRYFQCLQRPTPRHGAHSRSPRTHGGGLGAGMMWNSEMIWAHIAEFGGHPQNSVGLQREQDGSFSLNSVMDFWGTDAGLTLETVQKALQAHLFENIGHSTPTLRFQIFQGPEAQDPIMIKIPQLVEV
jgi:hypothetical protein